MKKIITVFAAACLATLAGAQTLPIPQYPADNPGFFPYNTDAGTGVSTVKTYTHAINFASTVTNFLNGVAFTGFDAGASSASGQTTGTDGKTYSWSGFPNNGPWTCGPVPYSPNTPGANAAYTMQRVIIANWTGNPNSAEGTMRLSGLVPGATYEFSLFISRYATAARNQKMTFMPGTGQEAYLEYNQHLDAGMDRLLVFRYKAVDDGNGNGELVVRSSCANASWAPNTASQNDSLCLSAFFNELLDLIELRPVTGFGVDTATLNAETSLSEIPSSLTAHWGFEDGMAGGNWEGVSNVTFNAVSQPVSVTLDGLKPGTNYVFRFKAVLSSGEVWSELGEFATYTANPDPVVTALPASGIGDLMELKTLGTSAIVNGRLDWPGTGFPTADVYLFFGDASDAGWTNGAPVFAFGPVAANGTFFTTVANLAYDTDYQYCLLASNASATAWSEVVPFKTAYYPEPALDRVDFAFAPGVTNALARVTALGLENRLVFAWADAETDQGGDPAFWDNTLTNLDPGAGVNTFPLFGVARGDSRAWRVFLFATGHQKELSGIFTAGYTYTWTGAATPPDNAWHNPANWSPSTGVPNGVGDIVIFTNSPSIDLSGVDGGEVVLGGVTMTAAVNGTTRLSATNETTIIWDNGELPARLDFAGPANKYFAVDVPQRVDGELVVVNQATWTSFPVFTGPLIGGGGRIVSTRLASTTSHPMVFGSRAGLTNRVEVAFDDGPFGFNGPGTVLLENQTNMFAIANGIQGHRLLYNGAHLVISNSDLILNNQGQYDTILLGASNGCKLEIINSSRVSRINNDRTYVNNTDTILTVNGPGTYYHPGTFYWGDFNHGGNSARSVFSIEDGALAQCLGVSGFGRTNIVRVAGAKGGRPAELSLRHITNNTSGNYEMVGVGNRLDLLPGGVVTNVATLTVGGWFNVGGNNPVYMHGNRVRLAGGGLSCQSMVVNATNALEAVISADGLLPVVANASATFAPDSKIAPLHEDFDVQGKWMIVKSPVITLPVGDSNDPAFFTPPSRKAVYKLWQGVDPADGTPALWLSCFKPGTMLMVR